MYSFERNQRGGDEGARRSADTGKIAICGRHTRVEIAATRCPFCKSEHILPLDAKRRPKGMQTRRKRAFDLVITPGAIRRKVIEFRTVAYHCTRCERCFIVYTENPIRVDDVTESPKLAE